MLRLMPVRKTPALLSVLALGALALTGCTPQAGAVGSCDRAAGANDDLLDVIDVSGELYEAPVVDMPTPYHAAETSYADVVVGEGETITSLDQSGVVDITLFGGNTGEPIIGTGYTGDLSAVGALSQWTEQFPGFEEALECATEGSRIVASLADDGGVAEETRQYYAQAGFPAEGGVVAVIDVRKVYPASAEGAPQYNDGFGLPSVVRGTDGRPGIVVPDGAAPGELVAQTLIKGEGAELTETDIPLVHYTGVLWDEKTVFDSSWDRGTPVPMPLDGVIEGFREGLVGQTIGSQVLLVIPPELGYGAEGNQGVPADATLVFVVDILGTQDAPAGQEGAPAQ